MFSESPYLRAAGLDWRQFYAAIQGDLVSKSDGRNSQHAAAFLLTLLPNLTSLKLPCLWRPCEMADKLIHATLRRAVSRMCPPGSLWNRPSLTQVTEFEPYSESGPSHPPYDLAPFSDPGRYGWRFDLADAVPFLALPKLRSFRARSYVARDGTSIATASEDAGLPPGKTLEAAYLVDSCLGDVAMAIFLRREPNLEGLTYSHCAERQTTQDWDACRLVMAIEREAESHLEGLEIGIHGPFRRSLAPGRLSMHGFQRLRKLHLPLEIAVCNLAADASARDKKPTEQELRGLQRLTDILVPASVSELWLHSRDPDRHVAALRVMFFDFAARKADWVPVLEEIRLLPEPKNDGAYKDACGKLKVGMEEACVKLRLGELLGDKEAVEQLPEE